ncbi:hypothetical protein [Deinococcus pimensis]|uniref:hypothetical protein n=1 Tax=Deinococcus pimensis TaxID=309888 RepID=UPI00146FBBCC|nr:hypothetical protein [Deinococcus pimensis]
MTSRDADVPGMNVRHEGIWTRYDSARTHDPRFVCRVHARVIGAAVMALRGTVAYWLTER